MSKGTITPNAKGFTAEDFERTLYNILGKKSDEKYVKPGGSASPMRKRIDEYLDDQLNKHAGPPNADGISSTGFSHVNRANDESTFTPTGYVRVDEATAKRMIISETLDAIRGNARKGLAFSLDDLLEYRQPNEDMHAPPIAMHGHDLHRNPVLAFKDNDPRPDEKIMNQLKSSHEDNETLIAANDWSWGTAAWLSAMSQHSPASLREVLESYEGIGPKDCEHIEALAQRFCNQQAKDGTSVLDIGRRAVKKGVLGRELKPDHRELPNFEFLPEDEKILKDITELLLKTQDVEMPDSSKNHSPQRTPHIISLLKSLKAHAAITSQSIDCKKESFGPLAISICGVDDFDAVTLENREEQREMIKQATKYLPILVKRGLYYDIKLLDAKKSQESRADANITEKAVAIVAKKLVEMKNAHTPMASIPE